MSNYCVNIHVASAAPTVLKTKWVELGGGSWLAIKTKFDMMEVITSQEKSTLPQPLSFVWGPQSLKICQSVISSDLWGYITPPDQSGIIQPLHLYLHQTLHHSAFAVPWQLQYWFEKCHTLWKREGWRGSSHYQNNTVSTKHCRRVTSVKVSDILHSEELLVIYWGWRFPSETRKEQMWNITPKPSHRFVSHLEIAQGGEESFLNDKS